LWTVLSRIKGRGEWEIHQCKSMLKYNIMKKSILAPKIWGLQTPPNTQNNDFLENDCSSFDRISASYGDHLPVENHMSGISRKITVGALGAQSSCVSFLETGGLTVRRDFVIRCSTTNNGLPSNNWFCLQGNIDGQWYMKIMGHITLPIPILGSVLVLPYLLQFVTFCNVFSIRWGILSLVLNYLLFVEGGH
jgi:hypothetical protein